MKKGEMMMTIPIFRPYVFLRCKKCGKKTDHVLVTVATTSRKGEVEEVFECQECGETKVIFELTSVTQLRNQLEAEA